MEDLKKSFLIRGGNIVGAVGDKNFSTAPIGTVLSFAGQTAPYGYLLCNGASYKVADYPDLYAVIGNTYGGDNTNFNVPNLIDRFIQGSITSGEEKEAGLPNITGSISNAGATQNDQFLTDSTSSGIKTNGALSITGYASKTSMSNGSESYNTPTGFGFDASKSNAIYGKSNTVQPPALTMVYIIKAFHTNEGVDSGVSDDVVDYVEGEIATKQENIFKKHITSRKGDASDTKPYCLIATLKTSNLTFVNEPIIIEGVMGNATSSTQKMLFKASFDFRNGAKETAKVIYGYINQSSLFSHIDLITTFDESAEIAYIYVHHKTNYSIIDADISVPQRNAELYLTIPETFGKTDTIIGTEAHRMSTSTNVKVLADANDIAATYLIKDIAAGDENEKTVSFKIRKDFFASYYAKRTFLLSANIYSLGFSKPVISLVEIFRGSADNYGGYVVNLQDTRFTGVTVTVNGDYLEIDVTFNSYEGSGAMVSCSSLSNVPIA